MYYIDYNELGRRVRVQRKQHHLTQEALAEQIDISDSFMGHIERGTRSVSLETLIKLANALNISVEYLLQPNAPAPQISLPADVQDTVSKLTDNQRKVFMAVVKTVSDNIGLWVE